VKQHQFEPSTIVVRRLGDEIKRTSHCQACGKLGREITTVRSGRKVVYWTHLKRPEAEPAPLTACEWQGAGRIWCCKKQGHEGSHHAHRGPRRDVH